MQNVPDWGLVSLSWFGYCHWSFIDPCFKFWLSSWFWRGKEHPCPWSPHSGLRRVLEVPDWDLASWSCFGYGVCLWCTYALNIGSLSWLWRCKELSCTLRPHLRLWRMVGVPDRGLASWSWFRYGPLSSIYPWSAFLLSILILKVLRILM